MVNITQYNIIVFFNTIFVHSVFISGIKLQNRLRISKYIFYVKNRILLLEFDNEV